MHILYIEQYAGTSALGMEYRPYYLAREWVKAGHSVTIFAASFSHVRSKQPEISGRFTEQWIDGIRFVWGKTPRYSGNGIGRLRNIAAFISGAYRWRNWLSGVPDMVIASSTHPLDIYPASRIARHFAAKLVWEVHDLWPLSPIELSGMSPAHPFAVLLALAEKTACVRADSVVSILPRADIHLVTRGMKPEKYYHVPNGVDANDWLIESRTKVLGQHREIISRCRENGHLIVGYAGSHGVANALDTLIDAASIVSDRPISFICVGNGLEKSRVRALVEERNLSNVYLLDPIPKSSIPDFLEAMDVLYIGWKRQPLYRFGISPNKLIDYMMSGRPIIHSVEAANDLVQEAGCGFTVAPENPKALSETLLRVSGMGRDKLSDIGRNGNEYVKHNLLYSELAARFLDAVRQ